MRESRRQVGIGKRAALRAVLFLLFSCFAFSAMAGAPFRLPISATVEKSDAKAGGWKTIGTMSVSFRQARSQFASRLAASGWAHLHTIKLGKGRTVEAWHRGGEELTLMVWSLRPGKSGFSYGVSKKAGAAQTERKANVK